MDEEIYTDNFGNYFDRYGRALDVNDLIARGIDVVGAWSSRSPYVSPDDPRFRNRGGGWFPGGGGQMVPVGSAVPGSVNPQGFQLSWWAAGLIGVVVGAFLLGKRR